LAELDIRMIFEILPHRYPMLLVDRILEFEHMVRVRGYKNITYNEHIFAGHFPNNPVLPGVYMIEALAQLGGAMILEPGEFSRKTPYLAGIDKAKFRRPVIPGDRLDMEVIMLRHKRNIGWVSGEATVDGQFACSAEIMFSITSDPRMFGADASILHA
jgi:3-hydroxyacyl-[acyl-carrier-protein] dehydratase